MQNEIGTLYPKDALFLYNLQRTTEKTVLKLKVFKSKWHLVTSIDYKY